MFRDRLLTAAHLAAFLIVLIVLKRIIYTPPNKILRKALTSARSAAVRVTGSKAAS